jgi:uncharacterized membrane protein YccC
MKTQTITSDQRSDRLRLRDIIPGALTTPTATYVMRTLLAVALALYLAFFLELPSPSSAAVTVIIVANPVRGAIISKSLWRIFGTCVGAVFAVLIVDWFAQSSLLFILAFAFWVGSCVFVAGMLQYFRAYAAILAAFTVAIIAAPALADPQNVLTLALDRLAVVVIGIVTSAAITLIFQPGSVRDAILTQGMAALRDVEKLIHDHAFGMNDLDFQKERSRLAGEIARLDQMVEFAGVEDFGVRSHAASLRRGFAALYAAMVTVSTASTIFNTAAEQSASKAHADLADNTVAAIMKTEALLKRAAMGKTQDADSLHELTDAMSAALRDIAALQASSMAAFDVAVLARLHQILKEFRDCIGAMASWRTNDVPLHGNASLGSFRDYHTAIKNGIRAVIAVSLAGLFWYVTAWTSGSLFLLFVGVVCGLVTLSPSAAAASVNFAAGASLSTIPAALCGFLLLPLVSGFPLMCLAMLPFLAIGIYYTTKPQYAPLPLAFSIFFIVDLGLTNPMSYNFQAFLNNSLAIILGAGTGALAFRIFLPPNPARDARLLIRDIRRAVQRLTLGARAWFWQDPLGFQVIANQRLQRLFQRLEFQPATRSMAIGGSGALLIIAQEIIEVRGNLPRLALPPAASAETALAMRSLGDLRQPEAAEAASLRASAALSRLQDDIPGHHAALLRAAASFRSIAAQMPEAARLLALESTCRAPV